MASYKLAGKTLYYLGITVLQDVHWQSKKELIMAVFMLPGDG